MSREVLIVGTGLGGLSAGLRLATKGYQVSFVEKAKQPGGRLNQIKENGFTFDTGPSFFSMPYEFEEFCSDCGIDIPFEFVELDPLYTVFIREGNNKFNIYKDIELLAQQFETIEPNFKQKFTAYLKHCEAVYNDTVDAAIKQNFDSIPDYLYKLSRVNPAHLPLLFRNFWSQTKLYFDSKEVRQIVSLIAFFLGRTPFDTSAIYTLLSHIEFKYTGYYNVKGGMYTIAKSLVSELEKRNVTFHYNTEIVDFESKNGQLLSLVDQQGKRWKADIFVINSDAAFFRGKVFKRKAYNEKSLRKKHWTMGYLTIYLGIKGKLSQIEHHNYFLGSNYEDYATSIMRDPGVLEKPYYYVNAISKSNPECAPEGCEALFIVCPVPNLMYKTDWSDKELIVDSIIDDLSKRIHYDLKPAIIYRRSYSPIDWQNQFNLFMGAGLGLSHHMLQIGALRPKNFDEHFKNVFYVGSSTTPGAGLPMVVISSKLVVERILKYFG
ncbi:MAG: phytoene desaturase family protein [Bacteroidales bacterium]|nr:phytoene desaturase family protein [Bacteroidales bacterium]